MADYVRSKDPDETRIYHFIFCSEDGTNDGGASDTGDLQGDTIATIDALEVVSTETFTIDSYNKSGATVNNVTYAVDTIVSATYSAGTLNEDVHVRARVTTTTSGETFDKTMIVPIRAH